MKIALGGGGSKGIAHIGVLKALEHSGHRIAALAGSSMGGLIWAIYLAGNSPDEIEARFGDSDYRNLFRRDRDEKDSLLGLNGVKNLLEDLLADLAFSDLSIPFAVTAVDLIASQEIVLSEGRLVDAMLATIALPGVFPPKAWGEYLLVDGGLSNPIPVSVARSLAPGLPVIAVALSGKPEAHREIPGTRYLGPLPALERVSRTRFGQAFTVFTRSISISGRLLTELRLRMEKPDLIISPDVEHIGVLDRVDVGHVVKLGEEAAEKGLPALEAQRPWTDKIIERLNSLKLFRKDQS